MNCKSVKTKGNLSGFAALYLTVKVPDEAPVENTWDNKSIRSVYSAWNFDAKSIRKASRKSLVFGRKSQLPKSRMDDVTESHNEIHEGMDDDRMSHISMQSFRKSQLSMHSKVMSDISLNSKETNDLGLRLDTCEEMEKEYDGHEDEEQEYDTTLSTNRLKLMKNKIPRKPIDHTSRFSRNGMQDLIPSRAGRVYGALWITRNHVE